jgi:ADP-heptose:LPS heptosyltransferase
MACGAQHTGCRQLSERQNPEWSGGDRFWKVWSGAPDTLRARRRRCRRGHVRFSCSATTTSATWHNRITNTRDLPSALGYLALSPQVAELKRRRFDIGIDVLGSAFGSLLLMRAGIRWRVGVAGYAGGHTGVQQAIRYEPGERVGRSALRLAEIVGACDLPGLRPQIFLTRDETEEAERTWTAHARGGARRIVIAPGGGHPGRAWGAERFVELARLLGCHRRAAVMAIGSPADAEAGARIAAHGAVDLTGRSTLRQSMAVISGADLVICNSSFAMHAAAASDVRAIVLLGELYESARGHAAQWGHGELTTVLGRDVDRPAIFEPADVLDVVATTKCHVNSRE